MDHLLQGLYDVDTPAALRELTALPQTPQLDLVEGNGDGKGEWGIKERGGRDEKKGGGP